jgi:hypothetical protein
MYHIIVAALELSKYLKIFDVEAREMLESLENGDFTGPLLMSNKKFAFK